jgi:PKD repeat protein
MTEIYFTVRLIVSSFLLLLFSFSANAQLQAGFTTDKAGGCSPLTIDFTNTTTGASANAIYKWDLGNSNTSALPNAAATYIQEQTYSVTLTVTDAGKSSSATRQISVYKRPAVDFSFDTKKGWLPLAVNFAATATPGEGTIANYFWDFGDGNTSTATTPFSCLQPKGNIYHQTNGIQYRRMR